MAEILLNTRPQHTNALFATSAFADKDWQQQFYRNNRNIVADILQPYQPYMLNSGLADTHDFYNQMCTIPQPQREVISHTVESIGSDNTLALAAMYEEHIYPYLDADGITLSGAMVGALSESRGSLIKSMQEYEKTLLQILDARKNGANRAALVTLEQHARVQHAKLQQTFEFQLQRHAANFNSPRARSALASASRGVNIARSGRINSKTVAKLEISKSSDVKALRHMSARASYLGNGLIAIDAGFRVHNVLDAKRNGEDYQRVAVQEITGFGMGTAAGIAGAKVGFTAGVIVATKIGAALSWTPAGWVILAGAGIAALGIGFFSARYADSTGKEMAGRVYDYSAGRNVRGLR
ncbi:MAG TPA: hypothetical protein VFY01_04105 [Rheinheimera sp.]|nr:hypothetical protein [Rheinheimera sp.]